MWAFCLLLLSSLASTGSAYSTTTTKNNNNNGHNDRPTLSRTSYCHISAIEANIRIDTDINKGLGAFTTFPINGGEWVGEYHGEMLTRPEVEARYWNKRKSDTADHEWLQSRNRRNMGMSGDYLFDMGDDMFIDGEDADVSGWCRFINHAEVGTNECNLVTRCTWQTWDGETIVQPRLWFIAARDIAAGEELCFEYGDLYW